MITTPILSAAEPGIAPVLRPTDHLCTASGLNQKENKDENFY